jgi:hypothetical protein
LADNHFTLGDTNVDFDLLSIVTHETGHFQGMAHSANPEATMWPSYTPGTISLRQLSPDDEAGICAIYPATPTNSDCEPTPRHGFSPLCAAEQPSPPSSSKCSTTAPGSTSSFTPVASVITALGALLFSTRRRSRRRSRSSS